MVGMGVGQEYSVQMANLLRRQTRIWILRRIRHFAAIDEEAHVLILHKKAIPAVVPHAARNKKLHTMPPSASPQSG